MIRLTLLAVLGLISLGCSTSRKVVVQNGYPGVEPPAGFKARPAPAPPPGSITYAPDARGPASPAYSDSQTGFSAPTNP